MEVEPWWISATSLMNKQQFYWVVAIEVNELHSIEYISVSFYAHCWHLLFTAIEDQPSFKRDAVSKYFWTGSLAANFHFEKNKKNFISQSDLNSWTSGS